jgi:thiol-disulfide isomerase/thioredoxin
VSAIENSLDADIPWRQALLVFLLSLQPLPTWGGELSELEPTGPPALTLSDLSGRQHSLADFEGRVVVVNFWASWCTPCLREMPSLKSLSSAMEERPFTVLAVNVGEGERAAGAMAKRLGIDFPVLLDSDRAVFEAWGNTVLPSAYVVDRQGRLRYQVQGPLEWDGWDVVESLNALVEEPPPAQ